MSNEPSESLPAESDHSYVVVARRYRPRNFQELVGQEHVGQALTNAIETGRVGHAYLFTGARGVGKTSTARIFAKALNNSDGPSATFDDSTDVSQAIDSGEDIDVIEIDGASNRGIDEIRSLRANVGVRPSRSRYKIYIIDEVHMLTQAAFNALLKTLEEPPEHVKFIFCTTDPEKMPITVLSRCQRFDFAPVEVSKIVGRLREIVSAEKAQADDLALELIARRASGSMRDSQSLLEQVLSFSGGNLTADQVHSMLGTADDERLHSLASAMCSRDAAEALGQLDAAVDSGVDAGRIAEQLLGYFRDLMAVTVGCEASLQRHTSASMHQELKQLGQNWGLQTVLAVVALVDQTLVRIRHSVYGRVLLESAIIQICNLPDLQAISDLAAAASKAQPLSNVARRPVPEVQKKKLATAEPVRSVANATADSIDSKKETASQAVQPDQVPHAALSMDAQAASSSVARIDASEPDQTPPPKMRLTPANVGDVFQRALSGVEPMTASIASAAEVRLEGEAKINLIFPAESAMSMRRMELPEHRTPICDAICDLVGQPVTLQLIAGAASSSTGSKPTAAPKISAKERMERMREIEAHPWVQSCVKSFGAEIVKVDPKPS